VGSALRSVALASGPTAVTIWFQSRVLVPWAKWSFRTLIPASPPAYQESSSARHRWSTFQADHVRNIGLALHLMNVSE
jgi:hypothetical protein